MAPSWRLVSEIYESKDYPIVVHIFYGMSSEEVSGYYKAHWQNDAFLCECASRGYFQGQFPCRVENRLERQVAGAWQGV